MGVQRSCKSVQRLNGCVDKESSQSEDRERGI